MEGKSLGKWIGRNVRVSTLRGDEPGRIGRFGCILEGVDPYGIVVGYEKDAQKINRFFPWHSVVYVHLAESESIQMTAPVDILTMEANYKTPCAAYDQRRDSCLFSPTYRVKYLVRFLQKVETRVRP